MASRSPDSKAYHLKDLSWRWGISRATVYRWRRDRKIPAGDIGPYRRIYSERLVQRIEENHIVDEAPRKRAVVFGENRHGMTLNFNDLMSRLQ